MLQYTPPWQIQVLDFELWPPPARQEKEREKERQGLNFEIFWRRNWSSFQLANRALEWQLQRLVNNRYNS